MRKLTIIATAIAAIAALSAIAVSMASAAEFEKVPTKGTFTIKSGEGSLDLAGEPTFTCKKDKGLGHIDSKTVVLLTIDVEGCSILSFIGTHTLGDPEGLVLFHLDGTLCDINKSKEEVGILLTPTGPVHIEVPSVTELLVVNGSVIGKITPVGGSGSTTGTVVLPSTALSCEGQLDHLEGSKNEGTTKVATLITTEELVFEEAVKVLA